MRDDGRLRKNGLPRMKCIRAFLRKRLCGIALGAGFRLVSGQRDGRQIFGGICPGKFDAHRREIRRIAREETPDGQEQQPDGGGMPQRGSGECAAGNFSFDPFDTQIGVSGQLGIFRRSRAAKKIVHAAAKIVPGRAPVHAEIEAGKPRMRGQLDVGRGSYFGRDGRLAGWWSLRVSLHHRLHNPGHYTGRDLQELDARGLGGGCQGVERKDGVALFELAATFQAG